MGFFTMDPKRVAFFIVLLASAALAMPANKPNSPAPPSHFKQIVKNLMKECQRKEFPIPNMMQWENAFSSSMSVENSTLCSSFISVFAPTSPVTHDLGIQVNADGFDRVKYNTWNCTNLLSVIKQMRTSSESTSCNIRASLAPLVWMLLTQHDIKNMDLENYDSLLWVAKPLLADIPVTKMKLPLKIQMNHMEKLMKMLWKVYKFMCEDKRALVVKWVKEHISQMYFNCSHAKRPPFEDNSTMVTERCRPRLKWLNLAALNMMGPYLFNLAADDVDSAPKDQLCEFFRSSHFNFTCFGTRLKPSLGKKLLQRTQQCFSGQEEFAQHVDKLGSLACYYYDAPNMTVDLSWKLFSQLEHCNNSGVTKLKRHLVETVMSNSSDTLSDKEVCYLGTGARFLSDTQLSTISGHALKQCRRKSDANAKWTLSQQKALTVRLLGERKCKNMSGEDLMSLWSLVRAVPSCVIKQVKAMEVLSDSEGLKNLCTQMRKSQLKALLQALCKDVTPSDLLRLHKLSGRLLRSASLRFLIKANIGSLDQVEGKNWNRMQAAFIMMKLRRKLKTLPYRRLGSVLQGITCKMIDEISDSEMPEMVQAVTVASQWLSKAQACCAAQRLFAALEKKRSGYFTTITPEEMDEIPTMLLIHLPPKKVKDLPPSVCSTFLDKMEKANLSLLPLSSPSRGALVLKALLCLNNGADLSGLSSENISSLGPLLCELHPSKLRLLAPDVLRSSLRAMSSCQHIPRSSRMLLSQLLREIHGNPMDWSAETMEALGCLLFKCEVTPDLPSKSWMKDVLSFLTVCMPRPPKAVLKKYYFDLITESNGNSNKTEEGRERLDRASSSQVPTVEQIEELDDFNVYWTSAQLEQMPMETFIATVDTLGAISDYSADQQAALVRKATQVWGPVSQMDETAVAHMRCITRGFTIAELEVLPFSLDSLEDIAQCGWTEPQMEAVWKGVARHENLTVQILEAADLIDLHHFICGLSVREIQQFNVDAFMEAVQSVNDIQCSRPKMQQLKQLAVAEFGEPKTWTRVHVSMLGNIMAGLDASEWRSLDPSVFPFLTRTCVPLIEDDSLSELSVQQIEALGPDNAAVVTNVQRSALGKQQQAAHDRALHGLRTAQAGAPSLSVEGVSAFIKPFLFLVIGLLLL